MFSPMSTDVFFVAEIVVLLLDLIIVALLIAMGYLAFFSDALYRPDQLGLEGSMGGRLAAFVFACVVTLGGTHLVLLTGYLPLAAGWFAVTVVFSFLIYWRRVRVLRRQEDMRVPYTAMVMAATCFLTFGGLIILWVMQGRVRLESDARLSVDTLAQMATIAVTAVSVVFTYILKSDQATRTTRQQIYQTLELQSIDLFRFEASRPDLVDALWRAKSLPKNARELTALKQYVFQMLNLFEMAYRFRMEGIISPTVFGSWVIWIWGLCSSRSFQLLWTDKSDDMPLNYVPNFCEAIEIGIAVASRPGKQSESERCAEFFARLAQRIGCDEVEHWLERRPLVLEPWPAGGVSVMRRLGSTSDPRA